MDKPFDPLDHKATYSQILSRPLVLKKDYFGAAPAPFIGRFGYPHVNVGILTPPEIVAGAEHYDAPRQWAKNGLGIPEIVDFRTRLVNSRMRANVRTDSAMVELAQEVGMASKPVEVEVRLTSTPFARLTQDSTMAPHGPSGNMEFAKITSNPHVSTKVWKVVDDRSLKAVEGISYLYSKGFDENHLSKLLSVGTLGIGSQRKMVPTRWSITATDDMLGKENLTTIRDFPVGSDYCAYFGSYLGNYYLCLCYPEPFSYELFETTSSSFGKKYTTDCETFFGRTAYAEETAGGYYTVRLALTEKFLSLKRQMKVVVIRVITDEYRTPLGVWVTREAARKSLAGKPISFSDSQLMGTYAKHLLLKKFGIDAGLFLSKSVILRQKGLGEWMG